MSRIRVLCKKQFHILRKILRIKAILRKILRISMILRIRIFVNTKILILRIFLRKMTILRKILRIRLILRIRIFVNTGHIGSAIAYISHIFFSYRHTVMMQLHHLMFKDSIWLPFSIFYMMVSYPVTMIATSRRSRSVLIFSSLPSLKL